MENARKIFETCQDASAVCTLVFSKEGQEIEINGYVEQITNGILRLEEFGTKQKMEIILDDIADLVYPIVKEVSEGVFRIVRYGGPPC